MDLKNKICAFLGCHKEPNLKIGLLAICFFLIVLSFENSFALACENLFKNLSQITKASGVAKTNKTTSAKTNVERAKEYFDLIERRAKFGEDFSNPELAEAVSDSLTFLRESFITARRLNRDDVSTTVLRVIDKLKNIRTANYPYRQTVIALYFTSRVFTIESFLKENDLRWKYELDVLLGELNGGPLDADLSQALTRTTPIFLRPTYSELDFIDFVHGVHIPIYWVGMIRQPVKADGFLMTPVRFFIHDIQHSKIILTYKNIAQMIRNDYIRDAIILDKLTDKIEEIRDPHLKLAVAYLLFFSLRENIYGTASIQELITPQTHLHALDYLQLGLYIGVPERISPLGNPESVLKQAERWIIRFRSTL